MINKGSPNINLNHENMENPYSMNVGEIMVTINEIAVGIGERLDFEQKLIDKKIDELQERAINRLENGEPNWKIKEQEFRQMFDFELEFVRTKKHSRAKSRDLLLDYLDITTNRDRKLTLYNIWETFEYDVGGVKFTFDKKLEELNSKIEQFVKEKKAFGTSKAYENLLSDTELAMPSKRRAIKQMADALYVLVDSGYLGSTYLGKILAPYHWGKARLMWDLDADYPLYADDYWIFAAGFI
jgi:hypothetical protein